jgi:hypothetical protein
MNSSERKKLFELGVESVFRNGFDMYGRSDQVSYREPENYSKINYKNIIKTIVFDPNIICDIFDNIDSHHKYSFMNACLFEGVDLYSVSKLWSDRINEMVEFDNIHNGYRELIGRHSLMSIAALLKPDFNWSVYYRPLEDSIRASNYVNTAWNVPMDVYMKNDKDSYRKFLENSLFEAGPKLPHEVRSYLYSRFISAGYLSSKFARKMRSDGSESASQKALRELINYEDTYDNFDELVLNFSDSRYESVLTIMARKLPERLLPSIMGATQRFVNSQWALAKRFQEIEEKSCER